LALAVVCGATGGLGPAVVRAMVERGDRVVAVARSPEKLGQLKAEVPEILVERTDLTRPAEVAELWKRLDALGETPRWLVNVTGGYASGSVLETTPEQYAFMHDLNLASAWWSCREGGARMAAAGGGSIVNVSARSAVAGGEGAAAYAVSKAGVLKLTEVLAAELKNHGVRVNAVLPAVIDTPANRASMPTKLLAKAVAPESIARVIAFLCSDDSEAVTGATIPV
jgi:NAD(P)-dependent dehydrogenase (short-subunit alcohol dehydrogenase family)